MITALLLIQIPVIWISIYFGYKLGKGEDILPQKMRKAIRTPEQERELEKKIKYLDESKHPKRG